MLEERVVHAAKVKRFGGWPHVHVQVGQVLAARYCGVNGRAAGVPAKGQGRGAAGLRFQREAEQ